MASYTNTVSRCCNPEPIIDTTLYTGNNDDRYQITVKAHTAKYGDYVYYYVSCPQPRNKFLHPFRHVSPDDNTSIFNVWEIVADNQLIRQTLQYLVMPDEDLTKICGHIHVVEYRSRLIKFLYTMMN